MLGAASAFAAGSLDAVVVVVDALASGVVDFGAGVVEPQAETQTSVSKVMDFRIITLQAAATREWAQLFGVR